MHARSRCLAILLLLPLTLNHTQYPTFAQGLPFRAARFAEVLSCVPDSAGNFLLLNLQSKKTLAAPAIHYLSLTDGRSVMVADFSGVVFRHEAQVLHCANPEIGSIRFGQFQSNPPIFRVSITASNPDLLKKIDFRCQAKSLLLKFPEKKKEIAEIEKAALKANTEKSSSQKLSQEKKTQIGSSVSSNGVLAPAQISSQSEKATELNRDMKDGPRKNHASQVLSAGALPFKSGGLFLSLGNEAVASGDSLDSKLPAKAAEINSALLPSVSKIPALAPSLKSAAPLPDIKAMQPAAESKSAVPAAETKSPPLAPEIKAGNQSRVLPETAPEFNGNTEKDSSATSDEAMAVLQKYLRSAAERKKNLEQSSSKKQEQSKFVSDARKTQLAFAEKLAAIQAAKNVELKSAIKNRNDKQADKIAQPNPGEDEKIADITNGATDSTKQITEDPPSQLEFSGRNPLQVKMKLFNSSKYKTFKLEDPPRFVLDLEDAQHPPANAFEPETNPWLKSVRIGNTSDKRTRVVLDLAQTRVHIKEDFDEKQKLLTLTLSAALYETSNSLKGRQVIIDAGHGGSDPGAQRGDIQEKELTLSIALKLKQLLEAKGLKVTMTRADDSFVSLEDRVKITRQLNPDAFVSIHINSLDTDRDIKGIETYYHNERSRQLAEKIHEQLVSKLQVPDRSVRKARFYVVNHTDNPAILAELGFISNKDERDKLISSDYQSKIADSLGQGLINFLSGSSQAEPSLLSSGSSQAGINESLLTINKQTAPREGKLR